MRDYEKLYIDGAWVTPDGKGTIDVINASTEEVMGHIPEGTAADIDMPRYQRPLLSFTPAEAPTGVLVYPNPDVPRWVGKLMFCVWNDGYPSLRLVTLDATRTQVYLTTFGHQ